MNSKKLLFIFILTILSVQFSTNISSAQDGGDEAEGQYYEGTNQDPYVDNTSPNITPQVNVVKPQTGVPAAVQKANGSISGNYTTKLSCPYNFERNLSYGIRGEDVRLLQSILNSDERTKINGTGPGSAGQETTLFGPATREAIKKFQALFIEYTGVADGNFGPKTRSVMNAICNGQNKTESGNQMNNVEPVQPNATQNNQTGPNPNDKIPPRISLSANLNAVEAGSRFKVIINVSEEIKNFTPDVIIVDGGSVIEIRKLSKLSYSMSIGPTEGSRVVIIQVEAEKVEDLNGNLNENASNEIIVRIIIPPTVVTNSTPTTPSTIPTTPTQTNIDKLIDTPKPATTPAPEKSPDLSSLIDKIVGSAPTCNYNTNGLLITGANINTSGCAQQQQIPSSTPTCNYSASGQLVTGANINTTGCAYNQQQQLANQQAQQNPYAQQQAQQQYAQQQAQAQQNQAMQGLGSILGKLLQGNNPFGGGNNQTKPPTAQNQGGTQQGGQETPGGGGNTPRGDGKETKPKSAVIVSDTTKEAKNLCKYIYKDEGKKEKDPLLFENKQIVLVKDLTDGAARDSGYYMYGPTIDALKKGGTLIDKCTTFTEDKIKKIAETNKSYCCAVKQMSASGDKPAVICKNEEKYVLSWPLYEENIGIDKFTGTCTVTSAPTTGGTDPVIPYTNPQNAYTLPNGTQRPTTPTPSGMDINRFNQILGPIQPITPGNNDPYIGDPNKCPAGQTMFNGKCYTFGTNEPLYP